MERLCSCRCSSPSAPTGECGARWTKGEAGDDTARRDPGWVGSLAGAGVSEDRVDSVSGSRRLSATTGAHVRPRGGRKGREAVRWRSEGYEAANAGRSSRRDDIFWPPRKDIRNAAVMVGVGGDACTAADVARVVTAPPQSRQVHNARATD
jgi:hypothetical protein